MRLCSCSVCVPATRLLDRTILQCLRVYCSSLWNYKKIFPIFKKNHGLQRYIAQYQDDLELRNIAKSVFTQVPCTVNRLCGRHLRYDSPQIKMDSCQNFALLFGCFQNFCGVWFSLPHVAWREVCHVSERMSNEWVSGEHPVVCVWSTASAMLLKPCRKGQIGQEVKRKRNGKRKE